MVAGRATPALMMIWMEVKPVDGWNKQWFDIQDAELYMLIYLRRMEQGGVTESEVRSRR